MHKSIRTQTFIEIQCAHGVAYHSLKLVQLFAALQQLLSQALVQIGITHHRLPQDHLLKLGQEGGIHSLLGDNNGARRKPWKSKKGKGDKQSREYEHKCPQAINTLFDHEAFCAGSILQTGVSVDSDKQADPRYIHLSLVFFKDRNKLYDVCRIYTKAQIIENLPRMAFHKVNIVSCSRTAFKIEQFNKGVW